MSADVQEPVMVSNDIIAHDFVTAMHGKMEQEKIDAVVKYLKTTADAHSAHGSVASVIFYLRFQLQITGGKTFNGDAGGVSFPGGAAIWGDVTTSSIKRLYEETRVFQFTGTPVYLAMFFFDEHSNVLGHYRGGAVGTILGTGGGKGRWS